MRELTQAEARVIAGLLGSAAVTERERLHRIAVPRSTYHAARRRAYGEGWVRDRYVPQPERLGLPIGLVLAARPFVDRSAGLVERWSKQRSCVFLLAGTELVLGVFLEKDADSATSLLTSLLEGNVASWHLSIAADLHQASVPVYFDYEGLWAHLTEIEGTVTYPRGLGGTPLLEEEVALTAHQTWAAGELLHRPFVAADGGSGHLVGPLGLPFSQQRMIAQGMVSHRVFLDPARLPPFRGHSADQVVLVSGAWRPGARPEALFRTLTQECRVFPFLYVLDGSRALLGALGRSGPPTPEAQDTRRPVLPTLQESLEGIEITQVLATNLRIAVDHRYDRLISDGKTG